MEGKEELEDKVQRLTRSVDEMRARMAALEADEPRQLNGSKPSSRRGFLRLGAAAALGAVGWAVGRAAPVSAANGGPLLLGTANLAESPTTVQGDMVGLVGPPVRVLAAEASAFSQPALDLAGTFAGPLQGLGTTTGLIEGVDGWAQGSQAYGVYGLTDSGIGVVGESNTGIGLYARRSGRIRQEALGSAGAPTWDPNLFEQVRDANGVLWIHGTTGVAPAVWRRVNTLRFDTADGTGGFFAPFRLVDTRNGGAPKASHSVSSYVVPGAGPGGASAIPADAIAVVGNLTAVAYTDVGFLTIFPTGVAIPPTSSVNFLGGQGAVANAFVCGLGTGGALSVYVGSPGTSHFIIDITGYVQ